MGLELKTKYPVQDFKLNQKNKSIKHALQKGRDFIYAGQYSSTYVKA